MSYKQWINELTNRQLMAYASQHGSAYVGKNKRQLCSFLMGSKSAKEQYKAFYGS